MDVIETNCQDKKTKSLQVIRIIMLYVAVALVAVMAVMVVKAKKIDIKDIKLWILCGVLGANVIGIVLESIFISRRKRFISSVVEDDLEETIMAELSNVGRIHNIGARPYQEDSIGMRVYDNGCSLAVVADGMGGLSNGDRVSKKIVNCMLTYGAVKTAQQIDGVLEELVLRVNEDVNQMLGPKGIYKSGSTLLAVLVYQNQFHWITVGDSRIYFYHDGELIQLNREHTVEQELLVKVSRGEISYEEIQHAPYKNRVTSFIGMGNLKYVEKSVNSLGLQKGDRILLMSDGVFNALSEQTMTEVLLEYTDVSEAAFRMEQLVIEHRNPKQDNFSAIILGF